MTKRDRRFSIFKASLLVGAGTVLGLYLAYPHSDPQIETMLDSSVSIRTIGHVSTDPLGDSVWSKRSGSGFFVSRDRCEVWTNHHVVADAALVEIFPRDWVEPRGIPAQVISADPRTDIAVLHMESCAGMRAVTLGDSDALEQGDEVFAVGNPFGRNPDSLTRGIVSHTQRFLRGGIRYLQTDAMINSGNSGGALFNADGEVIGINTAVATDNNSGGTGVSYAIPINVAQATIDKLSNGAPSWGDIGVKDLLTELAPSEAEMFNVPNGQPAVAIIRDVDEGPNKGVLKARDVIYEVNNIPIRSVEHLEWLISEARPGGRLTLKVMREGAPRQIEVAVNDGWHLQTPPAPEQYDGFLGLNLASWADEEGEKGRFKSPVIMHVRSLSPAHKAGITSSQHNYYREGPMLLPYLMEVRTITGIVHNGTYERIASVDTLDAVASAALDANEAILLEVEEWRRDPPQRFDAPFKHMGTSYHRVQPAVSLPLP
ncbi:MAG: hypothetical protein Kow006_09470 [Gammaproteobacteria bacterium]